jgi:hypothetical protein
MPQQLSSCATAIERGGADYSHLALSDSAAVGVVRDWIIDLAASCSVVLLFTPTVTTVNGSG